ncbi:unnamed protein product [Knipowitschia caucasica]|uniref:BHLH domain-containing protein n=1 Tax=Knipowitschia caucasica TaxID=637954 RepID=A0AAV2ML03_KNICA
MRSATPETQAKRTSRRSKVAKPVVEKRRRERINHSLEKLRLLLLETSDDERLKNPKVEKAEILESVVHFLQGEIQIKKTGHFGKKFHFEEEVRQPDYEDGVRTCLRRVSGFIADSTDEERHLQSLRQSPIPAYASAPGHGSCPGSALFTFAHVSSPSPQLQSHYMFHTHAVHMHEARHCDLSSQKPNSDTVWRPWPQ